MKEVYFVNTDVKAIRETIAKIGSGKLKAAVALRGYEMPKKYSFFKIVWNGKRGILYYKYNPKAGYREIAYYDLMILPNEALPLFGWRIELK